MLEGYFTYDLYSFFYIQFFPCVNTTENHNYKPIEEIDFYLKSTFVSFLMENIELTPKNIILLLGQKVKIFLLQLIKN